MHPFGTQLLRAHYAAIGWDPDNDYSQLNKPTQALLDLNFVPGLHFTLGKFPAKQFSNSAALSVLSSPSNLPLDQRTLPHTLSYPTLTGSVSYMTSNVQSFQSIIPTRSVPLTTITDWFAVPFPPRNKSLESQNGSVTAQDYLLYGRLHLPTCRLDALYSQKLSPTLQALATLVSIPSSAATTATAGNTSSTSYSSQENLPTGLGGPSIWNLMVSLNHNTGRWSQQYNYSTEDGLFGARVLHNFPTTTTGTRKRGNHYHNNGTSTSSSILSLSDHDLPQSHQTHSSHRQKLVDEDEVMDNVLRGRFSIGGELYFSAQKKSAGVSTGIRFCTIPDPPGSILTQQPTVISATLNPIMGQITTSYGTKIGPNLALATRFDFNLFSFDSDITFGLEWLQKRKKLKFDHPVIVEDQNDFIKNETNLAGFVEKDSLIRNHNTFSSNLETISKPIHSYTFDNHSAPPPAPPSNNNYLLLDYFWKTFSGFEKTLSILKARFSPVTGLTLMWEGRWKECLIGIGIQSEFLVSSRSSSSSSSFSTATTTKTTYSSRLSSESKSFNNQFSKNQTNDFNNNNNNELSSSTSSFNNLDSFQSPLIKGICLQLQYTN